MELGLATRKKVVEMERGDGCWEEGVAGVWRRPGTSTDIDVEDEN